MNTPSRYLPLSTLLITLALQGCGGGGGGGDSTSGSSATTLSGVAAVGSPIVNGTIKVTCASGSNLSTSTNSQGAWQTTLSGQKLPCAVQISGGTIEGVSNSQAYHSIATTAGNVNITPVTDLAMANLLATASPKDWFNGLSSNRSSLSSITQTQVDNTLARLSSALPAISLVNNNGNPITASFSPQAGNTLDDALSALQRALTDSGTSYTTLLNHAANNSIPTDFSSAMTNAYSATQSGQSMTMFPVSRPLIFVDTATLSATLTGNYNGRSLLVELSQTPGSDQTILGQAAKTTNVSMSLKIDGVLTTNYYESNYYGANPFRKIATTTSDSYIVYTNQTTIPETAGIGMHGLLETGTEYSDSSRSKILGTFVSKWSLNKGSNNNALLCEETTYSAVSTSEMSGTEKTCITIDNKGSISGLKITANLDNQYIELTSTKLLTPLAVLSTSPAANESNSLNTQAIQVSFSEPVDTTTLTSANFQVEEYGNSVSVPGNISYNSSTNTASFVPTSSFKDNTTYHITLTDGIKDISGDSIYHHYGWSFTTAAAPGIVTSSPSPYVYPVEANSVISASFNRAMKAETINTQSFTLKAGDTPVAGTVSYNEQTASFTPAAPLTTNTVYTATLTTAIIDSNGRALPQNHSWTFQTFAPGTATTSTPYNPIPVGLWQPTAGAVPASGNYVYLASDKGDYIGGGKSYSYTPLNAVISANTETWATGGFVSISVVGNQNWAGEFKTPDSVSQLQKGYYSGVLRFPFHNPVLGGLSWTGNGNGCNTSLGWFVVDDVSYVNNELTSIKLRFEQRCEQGDTALHGAIRWAK